MPPEAPSPANGYALHPDHKLSVALWSVILSSLHARLNDVEARAVDWDEALGDQSTALAQAILEETVIPQIGGVQTDLAALIAQIQAASDQLGAVQAGGVAATNVTVAGIAGLAATTVQAALAEQQGDLGAIGASLAGHMAAASVHPEARANEATARAGVDTSKWMAAQQVAQAIDSLGYRTAMERVAFTASGGLERLTDDLGYIVKGCGAGGSGARDSVGSMGGMAGEWSTRIILADQLTEAIGDYIDVVIGAGGAAKAANGAGNAGGDTTFGAYFRWRGGKGGQAANTVQFYQLGWHMGGGHGNNADLVLLAGPAAGSMSIAYQVDYSAVSVEGPTPGGCAALAALYPPAASLRHGSGGGASNAGAVNAAAGGIPGGGGGASVNLGGGSGAGGRGEVIVWRIKRRPTP